MKVKDYLKFLGESLKRMHDFGIKIDDYKYISLINDYDKMKSDGEKTAEGEVFECFLAKCDKRGVHVDWEDML